MMEFKKYPLFIVVVGIIISIGRAMLEVISCPTIKEFAILVFMAIVNYVAIGIVLLFLNSDALNSCNIKITKSGIDSSLKRKRKNFLKILSYGFIVIYFILGVFYMKYFKSATLNDVISIIALAFSIAAKDLSEELASFYYYIIKCKTSKNKKIKKKEQEN